MNSNRKRITRWEDGRFRLTLDELAEEEPLEIRVDTQPLLVTMRTPGHDEELAAGLLYSEGIIKRRADIVRIDRNPRNKDHSLDVFLSPEISVARAKLARHSFSSTSCGLCGTTLIQGVRKQFQPIDSQIQVSAGLLSQLPERLRASQSAFARTGGLHAAGIVNTEGQLLAVREDIGRHNAVDKIIGYGLLNGLLPFSTHVLVVSGRASFEIMQKSLAAQIPVVCAISAPSSLAVSFARANRQTLVGFLRTGRMNVYSKVQQVF